MRKQRRHIELWRRGSDRIAIDKQDGVGASFRECAREIFDRWAERIEHDRIYELYGLAEIPERNVDEMAKNMRRERLAIANDNDTRSGSANQIARDCAYPLGFGVGPLGKSAVKRSDWLETTGEWVSSGGHFRSNGRR